MSASKTQLPGNWSRPFLDKNDFRRLSRRIHRFARRLVLVLTALWLALEFGWISDPLLHGPWYTVCVIGVFLPGFLSRGFLIFGLVASVRHGADLAAAQARRVDAMRGPAPVRPYDLHGGCQ